jgi:peptide/nickel transport system substrate-binding protein
MEFRILGPLEIVSPSGPLDIRAPKQRALLGALLLYPGEVLSRERLIDELWGESPPPTAIKALHTYVSELRRLLGDATIVTRAPGYAVAAGADMIDAGRFVAGVRQARLLAAAGEHQRAVDRFEQALALWRGPALADVAFASFARNEAQRLDQVRLEAISERIDCVLATARAETVVGELQTLVAQHPLREGFRGQLMLALYRCGRQTDALEVFRDLHAQLDREVGLTPGPGLGALQRAILNGDPALDIARHERPQYTAATIQVPAPVERPRPSATKRPLALAALAVVAATVAIWAGSDGASHGARIAAADTMVLVSGDGRIGVPIPVGATPSHVVLAGAFLWTSNERDDTVSRIDVLRRSVQTVAVGHTPEALAYVDRQVWVANGSDATVVAIDPGTDKVVGTVRVGNGPLGVAGRGHELWVANSVDGTLSTVDTRSGAKVHTAPVGPMPTAVAATADAVWVTLAGTDAVAELDRDGRSVVQTVDVGSDPSAIVVNAGHAWVANTDDRTLSRIDAARGIVDATVRLGGEPVALATAGGTIWATLADGRVARIDARTGRPLSTVAVAGGASAVAATGSRAWVATLPGPASHRGGTLRVVASELSGCGCLDPLEPVSPIGAQAADLVYDGLVAYRRVGGPAGVALVADLAQNVPRPADGGRTYVFRLRPGVRFSNGGLVRPRDVRASLMRFFDVHHVDLFPLYSHIVGAATCVPGGSCDLAGGIVADDARGTVTFHLGAPDPDFLDTLALPWAFVVPAGSPRSIVHRPLPGTGPYEVRAAAAGGTRRLVLGRNPRFRLFAPAATPAAYPDRIEFTVGMPATRQIAAVEHGTADVAATLVDLPPSLVRRLATRRASQLHTDSLGETEYAFLNMRVSPFDRRDVRRALNDAVDRAALVRLLGGRTAAEPTCQILPPDFPGYRPYCPFGARPSPAGTWSRPDLSAARRLVGASGTRGARIHVWAPGDHAAVATYFARVLRRLGYRAVTRIVRGATSRYYDTVGDPTTRAQIGWSGWIKDYAAPSDFLRPLFGCAGMVAGDPAATTNYSELCDHALDRRMRAAGRLQQQDPVAGERAWAALDRAIVGRAAAVPYANDIAVTLLSARTSHYEFNAQWGVLLDQLWVR